MTDDLRFGIGIGADDVFWVQVNEALYQRSRQLPVKLIPINQIEYFTAFTLNEQHALLEEIVSQELDVLLGWSFSESLAHTVLNMGVPIVHFFETAIEHPLSVSPLGLEKIAEQLAQYLANRLDFRGNVLVIGGLLRDELPDDGRSRIAGIRKVFQNYPNLTCHHFMTDWGPTAYTEILEQLAEFPHPIDAIFGLSDSLALLGQQAALEMGRCAKNVPVVGINGDPPALAAIIEGHMAATVETSADGLANQAFDIALKIASGQSYPAHYEFNPRMITGENVARIAADKLVSIAKLPNRLVNVERGEQQQYHDYLETSLNISRQLGSVLNHDRLPVELARLIRTNYAYDHVQLFYWSEREQMISLVHDSEDNQAEIRFSLLDAGVLGEALVQDKPIFIPDCQRSFRFPPDPDFPDTRSRVVLPIRWGGKMLGLLDLHAFRVIHCTRPHLLGLQSLADQIGVAIRNAQLYSDALQAKSTAEKANQLKSRLLANISHELRTPLHVILSNLESTSLSSIPFTGSQHIQKNALHLLRLIDDLLDLSRAEIDELSLKPEIIEPSIFLQDVFQSIADFKTPDNPVKWKLDLPSRLPIFQADSDRLRQILLNLLSNAKKFTDCGEIVLGADVTPPYIHIWVKDTGAGIPDNQQENIFEPFFTGDERRKDGIGLGLSITRRLVALHRGLMTLDSHPERGSVFHVYFPLPNLKQSALSAETENSASLLVVSSQAEISTELLDYSERNKLRIQHIQSINDLHEVLSHGIASAIAWDADLANENDWQIIQYLQSNPQLSTLPFLLFSQAIDDLTPLTNQRMGVVLKPTKPKTLLSVINGIFKADGTGLILIVDDNADMLEFCREIVMNQFPAYNCRSTTNGKDAIAMMEAEVPSLVILDLLMPEIDGFEVIRWMRSNPNTHQVPITVLSGKILTFEDIKQLEPYSKITFQSKNVLSDDELISSFQQMLFDNQNLSAHTSIVVKHAIAYIHNHYEKPISRSDIARSVGVSSSYLTQIFHQELGLSLWDYLNRYRILKAKDLLQTTNDSVAYVSSMVGFDDPSYFSRVFRRYVGQSPRLYRNSPDTS